MQCLRADDTPIPNAFASGFIRREAGKLWLYTCWHVVTGFNPYDIKVGLQLPERRGLRVALQASEERQPGVEVIGGLQEVVIPLYEEGDGASRPRWFQDSPRHVPHPDLNAVGLFVPFWHDLVKIELPATLRLSDWQLINETSLIGSDGGLITPGDKCMVADYPFGFSAHGSGQPAPVALTRFAASDRISDRRQQLLLESAGAPGMSGGPVFVERGDDLRFFGAYVGTIYPDHTVGSNEKVSALGVVANISMLLWGGLAMVNVPSEPHTT